MTHLSCHEKRCLKSLISQLKLKKYENLTEIKNGYLLNSGEFVSFNFSDHSSYLKAIKYHIPEEDINNLLKFNCYEDGLIINHSVDMDFNCALTENQIYFIMNKSSIIDDSCLKKILDKLKNQVSQEEFDNIVSLIHLFSDD